MKNILKVRMLGGFTLEYKGKELVLDRNNVSKTTQLFQLLLLHTQDGEISKAALIDALYGRSDVENKNGSLNNTIFRLRKQLTAAGLPESSYININGGMCTWDPDIETSVDVCDFKQTIESARHEKSQKTKMEIYAKAWKLYTGEFLPDMMAVYVRYRQNATWQGSVYHMKNNEREDFNSELDLLKIIENCQNSTKNVAESG